MYGQADINQQRSAIEEGVEIVIATPGRLMALVNQGKATNINVITNLLQSKKIYKIPQGNKCFRRYKK